MESGRVTLEDGGRDIPQRKEEVQIRKRLKKEKPRLPAVYKIR